MKKLALALAGALFLTAAPAFACPHDGGGEVQAPKTADKDKSTDKDKAKTAEKDKAKAKDTAKKKAPAEKPVQKV
jgi:hypothetical protein